MASANKTPIFALPQWQGNEYMEREDWNTSFQTIEEAMATIDHLASVYGYAVTVDESDSTTTTILTVGSTAPVVATRKTVETAGEDATTYEVTTTIGEEVHTTTHTFSTTSASGTTGGKDVIPFEVMVASLGRIKESVNAALDGAIADLEEAMEAQGQKLETLWSYMDMVYDYECVMPAEGTEKPRTYTERLYQGSATKAKKVTVMNADGTYDETYTIGEADRERTWTKTGNTWKGEWQNE